MLPRLSLQTFAGAIVKTAAGGEIDVLDSGGFGSVTIDKSITIAAEGTIAGVLVSGTNGITVNAGPSDVVILRNLDMNGLGTGLNGIDFQAGGVLMVEHSNIREFALNGINFAPSSSAQLVVADTDLRNNAGDGILASAGAVSLDHVRLENNSNGLEVGGHATVRDSLAVNNSGSGFAVSPSGDVNIENSVASNNHRGVYANGGTMRISNMTITNNRNQLYVPGPGCVIP